MKTKLGNFLGLNDPDVSLCEKRAIIAWYISMIVGGIATCFAVINLVKVAFGSSHGIN